MGGVHSQEELEFELVLTGVLEDIYDINVRSDRDLLNRRRKGYLTLDFDYEYAGGSDKDVKVVVSIRDLPDRCFVMHADFSSPEAVVASAEDCEDLALAVRSQLDESEEELCATSPFGRRWDD